MQLAEQRAESKGEGDALQQRLALVERAAKAQSQGLAEYVALSRRSSPPRDSCAGQLLTPAGALHAEDRALSPQ